ncbi:PAS domain S-box protein [Algoriphagus halophytocola]|uniref:histidine kinase n=1 Tax=Algoriphagus halophytocola TaxID=2991499 RepID=A0ABY6MHL3_9BACT|nr:MULTISPECIES: PAS domain S-box protein [unclassified Algoriphagus]UZD23265.1 PAS domain S-box protein [Algoriphagus sp. TR-M5]WBL44559.1 PAS domain S-box protein [Algoriphagus sp. TR-M9]
MSPHNFNKLDADKDVSLYRICELTAQIAQVPKVALLYRDGSQVCYTADFGFKDECHEVLSILISNSVYSKDTFHCNSLMDFELDQSQVDFLKKHEVDSFSFYPLVNKSGDFLGHLVLLSSKQIFYSDSQERGIALLRAEATVVLQERLLISEYAQIERLFNLSNDLICIASVDGFFKKVNPSFTKQLGWDEPTLLTHSFFEMIHPDDLEKSKKEIEKLGRGESSIEFSHRFVCKDGEYVDLEWVATPESKSGDIFAIARNTTESKAREHRLEQSENRLRVFFESSQGLMCTHDLSGVFLSVNEAGSSRLGYQVNQVVGRSLYDIVPVHRHEFIDQYLSDIKKNGKASGQMVTRHRDGSYLIWMYNNVLERDPTGEVDYVIGNAIDITQRISLENELTQARKLLEETGKIAKVGGWSLNVKANELTWSPMTKTIHEVPENFVPDVSTGIDFYKEGESRSKISKAVERAMNFGEPWDLELQLVTFKGNDLWVRAIGQAEFKDGECVRVFGTFQDIDESKKAEIELEHTRKVLDNVINASSEVCVISTDVEGVITVFNVGAEKMLGYTSDEVVGKRKPDFLHKPSEVLAHVKELEQEFGREIQQHEIFTIRADINGFDQKNWTFLTKGGQEKSVSLVVSTMRDLSNEIIGYLGIAIDVTEKVKFEMDLINEKSRLSAFVQHAPAAVAMLDHDLKYINASNQWKKEYSMQQLDIIGKSHYDFFPELTEAAIARHQRVLKGAIERKEEDVVKLPGETSKRYVSWEMRPWYLFDGEIGGIMISTQNVTGFVKQREELERAKELAEEASSAKSEFLANMSHEIRTPLNGVIGFTDLVLKTRLNETQNQYLTIVNQSANALLSIINDILDFSKIEAGKLELDVEKCDLYEISSQATDIITYQIQQKGLEMLLNVAPELPRFIYADSVRLKQVLVNLLGNASKFTQKGEIELKIENLETYENKNKIRFSVRDTGIGIKPEKQSKIFEAFSQEDSSTTKKYGGTGLGLAISNSLLKMMGSQLNLTSEVDKGSTFYFDIVLDTEEGEKLEWFDVSKIKKVLIVDDNDNNRLIVRQMLLLQNIQSLEAANGLEALQKLAAGERYDVVLMDYHMPFMDGLETIQKIRETIQPDPEELPIMLLHSSSDDQKIIPACREYSVMHRLIKPLKIQEFYTALSHIHSSGFKYEGTEQLEDKGAFRAFTVLVAEDNIVNMLLAKTIVAKIAPNATFVEAANGKEALNYCQYNMPDIILMDVQMPEMNGYEATGKIRALDYHTHVPIIAFTAGNVKGEREKCIAAGMDDFLVKPVVEENINMIFKKWLELEPEIPVSTNPSEIDDSNILHYNSSKLLNYIDHDMEMFQNILLVVKEELEKSLSNISNLVEAKELKPLKEAGHKLYGTAASGGMKALSELAFQLEHLKVFDDADVLELFEKIQVEVELVKLLIDRDLV